MAERALRSNYYSDKTCFDGLPIGTVISVFYNTDGESGSTIADRFPRYLPCDGQYVNANDYPGLYLAIKNTYGGTAGAGMTLADYGAMAGTIRLPDYRAKKLNGVGGVDGLGSPTAPVLAGANGVAGGTMTDVGAYGGEWYITQSYQAAQFVVSNPVTTGYSNVTGDINASGVAGNAGATIGPLRERTLSQPPDHSHGILTSDEVNRGSPLSPGSDDPYTQKIYNQARTLIQFAPPSGSTLAHSHGITKAVLNVSSTVATWGDVDQDAFFIGTVSAGAGAGTVYNITGALPAGVVASDIKNQISESVSFTASGMTINEATFTLLSTVPINSANLVVTVAPDGRIPLTTKYFRVKYLIKVY